MNSRSERSCRSEPVASVQISLENGQTFVSDIYGHLRIEDLKNTERYVLSLAKKYLQQFLDTSYDPAAAERLRNLS